MRILLFILLGVFPVSGLAQESSPAQINVSSQANARELVQKIQDRLRSDTSITRYTMRIVTADWQLNGRLG